MSTDKSAITKAEPVSVAGLTNLSTMVGAQFAALVKMETAECKIILDERPKSLNVVAIQVTDGEKIDAETAEVRLLDRTMFLTDSGEVWLTTSRVVARLSKLVAGYMRGKGFFAPPLVFNFTYKRLGPERFTIIATLDDASAARLVKADGE